MSAIWILKALLIVSLTFTVVGWGMHTIGRAGTTSDGWKWLRPSPMVHFATFGSIAFAILMWWLYLFVGSARTDASDQEFYMMLIAGFFSLSSICMVWGAYLTTYSWRGGTIRKGILGRYRSYDLKEISNLEWVGWRSEWRMVFHDGSAIYISPFMNGFDDLGDHIGQIVP